MHTAYLEAKRSIDDRSLDRRIWDRFVESTVALAERLDRPIRIAEIGAGTGTMIDRLREWGAFDRISAVQSEGMCYDAWELNRETATVLRRRLEEAKEIREWRVYENDVTKTPPTRAYDVVVAHAVLDLFPVDVSMPMVESFLGTESVLYAPILFDGVTVIEPILNAELDAEILNRYHESMGGAFARSHLVALQERGFRDLEAGSSDWIVLPGSGGDGATLLLTLFNMMEEAVSPFFEGGERERFLEWIAQRREQAKREELFFEAHQLDLLAVR